MALIRQFIAIGLLSWFVSIFLVHQDIHSKGCLSEAAWANQNDEYYDRELSVE
jgi:hypothetical protein